MTVNNETLAITVRCVGGLPKQYVEAVGNRRPILNITLPLRDMVLDAVPGSDSIFITTNGKFVLFSEKPPVNTDATKLVNYRRPTYGMGGYIRNYTNSVLLKHIAEKSKGMIGDVYLNFFTRDSNNELGKYIVFTFQS